MRQPKFIIVAGAPGMGKSTFVAEMVKKEKGNCIVYKHASNIDDKAFSFLPLKTMNNWRQGSAPTTPVKCKISGLDEQDYEAFLKWVFAGNFSNGTLVIDDGGLFERNQSTKTFKRILAMRRHLKIDLIIVYHGLTQTPIDNFPYANYLVLFNTTDNFFYKASRLPNFERLVKGNDMVKQNRQNEATKYKPVIINMST